MGALRYWISCGTITKTRLSTFSSVIHDQLEGNRGGTTDSIAGLDISVSEPSITIVQSCVDVIYAGDPVLSASSGNVFKNCFTRGRLEACRLPSFPRGWAGVVSMNTWFSAKSTCAHRRRTCGDDATGHHSGTQHPILQLCRCYPEGVKPRLALSGET